MPPRNDAAEVADPLDEGPTERFRLDGTTSESLTHGRDRVQMRWDDSASPMGTLSPQELSKIDGATELQVASERPDGTMRPYVTIWHATVGETLYVRSARGPENGWYRRAVRAGLGRIDAGGVTTDVTFELADPAARGDLDAALHRTYDRLGRQPIAAITGDDVPETALRVLPRG